MTTDDKNDTGTAMTQAPPKAVATVERFVRDHGGSATAVAENLGNPGVRLVLVGQDGAMGDVMVPDSATAESVVGAVDGLESGEWDSETAAALTIGAEHRRRMAGSHAK